MKVPLVLRSLLLYTDYTHTCHAVVELTNDEFAGRQWQLSQVYEACGV